MNILVSHGGTGINCKLYLLYLYLFLGALPYVLSPFSQIVRFWQCNKNPGRGQHEESWSRSPCFYSNPYSPCILHYRALGLKGYRCSLLQLAKWRDESWKNQEWYLHIADSTGGQLSPFWPDAHWSKMQGEWKLGSFFLLPLACWQMIEICDKAFKKVPVYINECTFVDF